MRITWHLVKLVAFLIVILSANHALSECTPQERIELGKQGYTRAEVNRICSQQSSSSEEDLAPPNFDQGNSRQRSYNSPPRTAQFCCDAFGNRRCILQFNQVPPGSPCFCFGQGQGLACH